MPTKASSILDDILASIEFRDADRTRLVELHARIAPQFAEMAVRFYARILATPGAAAVLSGPEQLARLHVTLVDWMSIGLLGPYDATFYAKRSRIGHRHVEIGLPQHYMFTTMNAIREEYGDRIKTLYDRDEAHLVTKSVGKLLDVELALMLRHYQLDSEAKLVERERRIHSDRAIAIQTLSAGLAHEVRNPLNSAQLQLELLERRLKRDGNDPKLVVPIELAHHEIDRLTRLLNEFLAFVRPADLALADHDVVAIARTVVTRERRLAEQRGATLELVAQGEVIARIDALKLQQIIRNLVRNSIEAVSTGGHVTVAVRADDSHVYLRVEDDGPGIPDAVRSRIYEPFFTTKEAGTGLGMAVVHSMVTLHGGTIDIESSSRGTQFDVAMPRRS